MFEVATSNLRKANEPVFVQYGYIPAEKDMN